MAESATRAAAAMYERSRAKLDEFVETLEAVPRQAGALFTINGVVAGLDVFDSPATWRKSMRKLVQSYGLDALDRAGALADCRTAKAGQPHSGFLSALKRAARERFPAIGLGEDVRIAAHHRRRRPGGGRQGHPPRGVPGGFAQNPAGLRRRQEVGDVDRLNSSKGRRGASPPPRGGGAIPV